MPSNRPGYDREYYHSRRNALISILGGSCQKCGQTNNLEFHHTDLNGEHGIGSWRQLRDIENRLGDDDFPVILLCKECHALEHNKVMK